jgi:uncharacterized RDD family membrane protein YckC
MSSEWSSPSGPAGPPSGGSGPSGPRASFGLRLVALIIDVVITTIIDLILFGIIGRGAGQGLGTLLSLAYFTYFEGSPSGQTPGKRAMGIRVIDFQTGGPLGYGRALLRWVCRLLSGIPCALGYFWMLWDKERQTWHDKLAQSVVVPTSSYPVDKWPG